MSTVAAIASLEKAGIHDITGDLRKTLESFDGVGRRGLTEFLQQSKRVVEEGIRSGMKADDVVKALHKGGPEAVLAIQAMRDPEAVMECLKGFDKFGEPFANFAKKGDEAAVRRLAEHWDEIDKLPKATLDDLLAHPTKYFDELGKPTAEFRRAMESIVEPRGRPHPIPGSRLAKGGVILAIGAGIGVAFDAFDKAIDHLPLPPAVCQFLHEVKWWLVFVALVLLAWPCLPILWPPFLFILRVGLRLLARFRGRLGTARGVSQASGLTPGRPAEHVGGSDQRSH